MIHEYLSFAFNTFRQRRMRTLLTMIGIFIGIAAVVTLISLGQGLEKKVKEQFEKLGTDKLFISPKTAFAPPGSSNVGVLLKKDDWEFIKDLKGIEDSTAFLVAPAKVEFNNEVRFYNAFGLPSEGIRLWRELAGDFDIETGRYLRKGDKFKVVLGSHFLHKKLFSRPVTLGDAITVQGKDFNVVGIWEYIGTRDDDTSITMPLETARELFSIPERVDGIIIRTAKGVDPGSLAETLKKKLRKHKDQEEGQETFSVRTFDEVLRSFTQVLDIVQVVLVALAGISLLVGGIGIMNTMYTSVLERTREIGVMKAIGAKNSDILRLYVIESGCLGIVGGVVGIIIGMGISKGIELFVRKILLFEFITIYFPWYMMLGVIFFSFIVGAASGVLPAINAAKQKPVDALRYE